LNRPNSRGKAGDSSPSDPYGWQETYDAVQALLKWAEVLDQMGNEGEAQEMRDKAEQVAAQDAASFLDQPIPSDPCGDYLHTLLKFEQLAIMLGLQDIEQQLHERGTQILDQCTNRFELEVDYYQLVDWSELHWHFQDQLAYSGRVPFWVPMYDVQEFGPIEGEGTLTIVGNGLDDMEDEYCVWTTSGTVDLTASGEMRLNELLELEIVITLDGTASMSQTFTCCCDGGECETWTQGNSVPVTFGPYTLPVQDGYTIEESITATTLPPDLPPYVSVQGTLSLTLHILHLPT